MSAEPVHYIAPEEYLALERASETKHEYCDGELFAMAGASEDHVLISGNLLVLLLPQVRRNGCRIYSSDLRVKVNTSDFYTYPDLTIVCGDREFEDNGLDTLTNPTAMIEILSPSTEAYDRGRKFDYYRALPSLREYVLVSQDQPKVERFTRQADGVWSYEAAHGLEAGLTLPGVRCELRLADVYTDASLTAG